MAKKQVVTAILGDGKLSYQSGAVRGSRKMFYVVDRLTVYVKGACSSNDYERLTTDLMRRCAAHGVPLSELKRVAK